VGYAGGSKANPTYHDLGSHAEVLQIEFDPIAAPFETWLERFWTSHDWSRRDRRSQYRAILLCENQEQHDKALASIEALEHGGKEVGTEVLVGLPFWRAEDYHQKWKLRQQADLFADLAEAYPCESEALDSVAATKLNALVAGHLDEGQLRRQLRQFGLTPTGLAAMRSFVPRRLRA